MVIQQLHQIGNDTTAFCSVSGLVTSYCVATFYTNQKLSLSHKPTEQLTVFKINYLLFTMEFRPYKTATICAWNTEMI
jgi:hypothetical protein